MTGPDSAVDPAPRQALLAAGAAALIALCVYLPALRGEFVNWDDPAYVVENGAIHRLDGSTLAWAFTAFHSYNWHPLTWLSHAADYALFGPAAWGHHLTSIVLHALNTALLLWVLWRMTGALGGAAAVALLFALHPLHVESVAWISERKDVLSTLFWLATLWAHVRYAERPGGVRYGVVALLLACGLMAKPMLVTLPFVLLLLDYWPLRRLGRRAVIEKLPLLALAAGSSVLTLLAQRSGGSPVALEWLGPGARLANAVVAYARYLVKTVWPADLVAYYPLPSELPGATVAASAALLLAVTALAVARRRRSPYLLVGWLWYLGTLVPVIGLVQIGAQAIADRYTYVPLIGVFLMVVWGALEVVPSPTARRRLAVAAALLLALLSALTVRQIGVWRNSVRLWEHAAAVYPDAPLVRANLAQALGSSGDADRAAAEYRRVLEDRPDNAASLNNLGNHHARRGEFVEAERLYLRSIEADPEQVSAYNLLGVLRLRQSRLDEAAELFERALTRDPDDVEVLSNLGVVHARRGDLQAAMQNWRRGLELEPDKIGLHENLARAYRMVGDPAAAIRHYERILRLQPGHAEAARRLAELRGSLR